VILSSGTKQKIKQGPLWGGKFLPIIPKALFQEVIKWVISRVSSHICMHLAHSLHLISSTIG